MTRPVGPTARAARKRVETGPPRRDRAPSGPVAARRSRRIAATEPEVRARRHRVRSLSEWPSVRACASAPLQSPAPQQLEPCCAYLTVVGAHMVAHGFRIDGLHGLRCRGKHSRRTQAFFGHRQTAGRGPISFDGWRARSRSHAQTAGGAFLACAEAPAASSGDDARPRQRQTPYARETND